jgi:uncharacterized protein (TIGR02001 family)
MKKTTQIALACALSIGAAAPALAQAEVSYNIGVVSLYKSSGVDAHNKQNDDATDKSTRPELQGGVDVDFGNGFYVGNWNSTGRFGDANLEIDLYGGYAGEVGPIGYDAGVATYYFPNNNLADVYNGTEVYGSLSYGIVTFKMTYGTGGATKSADNKAKSRYSLTFAQPINEKLTAKFVYADRNNAAEGYYDYAVGADYDLGEGLTVSGTYSAASDKGQDASTTPGANAIAARQGRLVVGLSKSF